MVLKPTHGESVPVKKSDVDKTKPKLVEKNNLSWKIQQSQLEARKKPRKTPESDQVVKSECLKRKCNPMTTGK